MKIPTIMRAVTILVLLCAGMSVRSESVCAQVMDFSQIDAFESIGTGTVHGGSSPKTVIDDGERHTIFITVSGIRRRCQGLLEIARWKPLNNYPAWTRRSCISCARC